MSTGGQAPDSPGPAAGPAAGPIAPAPESKLAPPPKPTPWWIALRQEPPTVASKLLGATCIGLLLLVWYLFTRGEGIADRIISPSKLPSPFEVFSVLPELHRRGLGESILATLSRVLIGFFFAMLVGVGTGVAAASFRSLQAFFTPIVLFGRSLPLAALVPLTILWFGIEETQKEMFIFFASVPFVFSDTVKAVSLVPQRYVETAETLGASRIQIILKVLFPLALPDIVTSLRFLFGLALGYIMLAEVINAREGLGYMINTGERLGYTDQNYLLLVVIGLLAYSVDWTIGFLQRHIFSYRRDL